MNGRRQAAVVIIIGAGPTGVTAATLLAQYGIETLVLDRWPTVYPQPRAVHLDDEVFRIVDRLGVGAEFARISRPAAGLRLIGPKSGVLAEFVRPAQGRNGYPQANMFDQPVFEELLRTNLTRYPEVTLRGDAEVTGISDRGGGRVRVTFTDRTDGREHWVDADYLLGCDGANSMVRDYIGSSMRDLRFEQRWLVIDVESPVDLKQWDGVHQLCDPRRAGTFMQIGDTRYRWEFQLLAGETADDFRTLPALRPLIAPWTRGLTDRDLTLIRVAEYTFRAQIADSWRRGTTFLLGDAAHLTPPFVGQGMCAGLRDAMNLSWKLAGVINTTLDAAVLDTYEQERKPHVRKMIGLALLVGRVMTGGGRFGNLLRRTVVPRMHLIPGLRDRLLDSTTPPLPCTALVHKTPAAGTLCPNAATGDGHRLDSVLGNGFAVVSSCPLTAGDAAELGRHGAISYLASPGSEVAEWLRATGSDAVLVRPDRTVMHAGRDTHAVCQALPTRAH
jgi:3-(3-hydroxy-phenyl)propionate hydroxylase